MSPPSGFSVTSAIATAAVSSRAEHRVRAGHLWIYRSDVERVRARAGEIVRVIGPRGNTLGHALFSDRSAIALRLLTRDQVQPDTAFWRRGVAGALRYRESLAIDATAYRLVHGEGDLLPSLVVDRYGDVLVLQTLSQGMDRHRGLICDLLVELLQPVGILARNDPHVRSLEGLPRTVDLLYGDVPHDVLVREGAVRMIANPWSGQKTGLFLDQRENRSAAASYAHGRGLDCFAYTGGFALHLARRCREVLAVDVSEEAIKAVDRNAALNEINTIRAETANIFDFLRALERAGEEFDTIILDPPAFAKNRSALPKALGGYKEINLRAMKLLALGGVLMTCSCSYHLDERTFSELVSAAANDAKVRIALVEKRMQARDHPVLLGVPETYYLKCLVLRRLG